MSERTYIAIDLKSFYASVECVERGLNPMDTNLVVADESRTEKTICLAVSPSLKAFGIPGRARLFEVVQRVREANAERKNHIHGRAFAGSSYLAAEIATRPELELDYIVAAPRMALYMDYSSRIYEIYLSYISSEDIHVYSIDEVFMDVTDYLKLYGMSAHELAGTIIRDVLGQTGITATAGIGSNLYLCKVAMDIMAKHVPADEDGVRIAELDEMSYRKNLWNHQPITDFWRVGRGYAKKLKEYGMFTMGDVARCSVSDSPYYGEDLLYRLFGVNAELLIDHAWGWEPVTMQEVKAYQPSENSISSGQVLSCPYPYDKARLVVKEMADLLVLDLVEKRLVTDQIVLTIGYDITNLNGTNTKNTYQGEIIADHYGRKVPKHAHGTNNLPCRTSSAKIIVEAVMELFDRIINKKLTIRRITITANRVIPESAAAQMNAGFEQLELFTDYAAREKERKAEENERRRERQVQEAVLEVHKKYGKNALVKGMNLEQGATTMERNARIGGHKA